MKHDHYQTVQYPDGTVRRGVFDTPYWYDRMRSHVEVKDKALLDVGCNLGMFGIRALQDGASFVEGIDHDTGVITEAMEIARGYALGGSSLRHVSVEMYKPKRDFDIILFSMIIHWIGKVQFLRLVGYAKDTVVVIFRSKNDGYSIPANGKWFPTLDSLSQWLHGFKLKHNEVLLEQDNNKKIILAVYEKPSL